MPLRRFALATAVTAAAMSSVAVASAPASAVPLPLPLPDRYASGPDADPYPESEDQLVLTVTGTGDLTEDGTYTLDCHPTGGTHRAAQAACDRLDEATRWGRSPFAPVPAGATCAMMYGGPATARLVGTWAGRPVDARFSRSDGCEIARWNQLVPLLPSTRS
ncbi:SSI family serine proteinase inhibitor [Streptomyces palmae]|uniref:Subtilisin inhibitor domain-containing protein n=1 Tax=Streptomyces palmae TaxID=1701085 RepID=A0A4Z0GJA9_9ACTN|nr:SSI family serine proteinase inhibitor [Streptomyces palmae]TGA96372.1 hypothetical protein E4099_24185 [Streptomyces palmae]